MTTNAKVQTQTIEYRQGDTILQGHLAFDASADTPRPGVLVFPEWWGVVDYVEQRARMLAELGYVALVADMYGNGRAAADADEAGALMNAVLGDMETGTARVRAAYDCLAAQPQVDASRIAAVGYCFGGAMALHAARIGMALRGVVSFHGALGSFHRPAPGEVQAKLLVCHGAKDAMVSAQDVADFKAEMADAGVDLRFVEYPSAMHGFTSREASRNAETYGIPIGYDAAADAGSWHEMQGFLERVLA
jgi:dienelactone hydrolase